MASETSDIVAERQLDRMIYFSDALFAISITLLVLDIAAPQLESGATPSDFGYALAGLLPNVIAFVVSFLVIALFWQGHHRLFANATRFHPKLLWPNLFFLMAIVVMPFATAFFSANAKVVVVALVYNLTLLACSVLLWFLSKRVMRYAGVEGQEREDRRSAVTIVAALLCVALAFIAPEWSQIGMLLTLVGPHFAKAPIAASAVE